MTTFLLCIFFFRKWNWKYDSAHLEIFCKSWDLELAAMLSPFLVLRGFSEELCKFWILELAAMLSPFPVLRIFEKIWFDLAAMFEFKPSSRIFH